MASNKYNISDQSVLLKKKLEALAKKIQGGESNTSFQTKEEYLLESIKMLHSFYKEMKAPLLESGIAKADTIPNLEDYNQLWSNLLDDLTIVFAELENIESLSISNFNFITTESNRLRSRLKTVSSKLEDFVLYSITPLKDTLFFKESFVNISKIDFHSKLLNKEECTINQDEGILTLPIDQSVESAISITEKPDRKSTRLNSSHTDISRMPSSA